MKQQLLSPEGKILTLDMPEVPEPTDDEIRQPYDEQVLQGVCQLLGNHQVEGQLRGRWLIGRCCVCGFGFALSEQ